LASRSSEAAPDQKQHAVAEPSTSGSGGDSQGSSRRRVLLRGSLAPLLVQLVVGSDDATTIINSVLSGYGLPTLKASAGYKVWDEFADEYTFEVSRGEVATPGLQGDK
jgi:hypothetical protein